MSKNLIILTTARSGSSMVAEIFVKHGMKSSRGDYSKLADGAAYWTYENPRLKSYYRDNRIHERNGREGFHKFRNVERFADMVSGLPTPYVIKTGVEKWPLFNGTDAVVIKIRRNPESVARSISTKQQRHQEYNNNPRAAIEAIEARQRLMDEVPGHDVYTEAIISGDYTSLLAPCEELDIEFDAGITEKIVDPSQWHY